MVLYLGSEAKLRIVPYNPEQPAFHTKELDEQERPVLRHFSTPYVLYIGSHEGCGCSFRHAFYENGQWSDVVWAKEEDAVATQKDHQDLVEYLKAVEIKKFEIYACWDGDYALPAKYEETITINDLLHPDFFFKERVHYRITIGS